MPNHFHIIGEILHKKDLSKFMHGLMRSYTAYFNEKYSKVGHLWQGRFKSKVINKDAYMFGCLQYVELNPVRAEMVDSPEDYPWSSYRERNLLITNKELSIDTPDYLGGTFPIATETVSRTTR